MVIVQELRFPLVTKHRIISLKELRKLDSDLNYAVHIETGPV
jgi:hypothetical protein